MRSAGIVPALADLTPTGGHCGDHRNGGGHERGHETGHELDQESGHELDQERGHERDHDDGGHERGHDRGGRSSRFP
jgi:hypothetical protein